MLAEKMLKLGQSGSAIRDIAAYADARREEIGSENVFDFSIGNPSTPAPEKVRKTLIELLETGDSLALHGYTAAPGAMSARKAAARQESKRAGYDIPADCVYLTSGASSSLAISLAALVSPDLTTYEKNRDTLYTALTQYGFECVKPDGAFYLFLRAPQGDSAAQFCEKAKKHEIMLVPSDSFGIPGYARLAYCASEKTVNNSLPAFKKLAEEYGL